MMSNIETGNDTELPTMTPANLNENCRSALAWALVGMDSRVGYFATLIFE